MGTHASKLLSGVCAAFIVVGGIACSDDDDGGTAADGAATDAAVTTTDGGGGDGSAAKDGAVDTGLIDAATVSDGPGGDAAMTKIASSTGLWVIYPATVPATNGATNIKGTAEAFDIGGGKTKFVLSVTDLPANTEFGAHLHKLACDDTMAGGHYQDMPPPDGGVAADVATATNEVWLDFTTNASGAATKEATVNWKPRAGQAKAIVVHAMKTGVGGAAGNKLACVNMPF